MKNVEILLLSPIEEREDVVLDFLVFPPSSCFDGLRGGMSGSAHTNGEATNVPIRRREIRFDWLGSGT